MMHYGYDKMWINVELVEVPTFSRSGPQSRRVHAAARGSISQDSYAGIQHA